MVEHWYLACMILVTSPFNWLHAVTLTFTFDLFQGQICCRAGDHNSPNLLVIFSLYLCSYYLGWMSCLQYIFENVYFIHFSFIKVQYMPTPNNVIECVLLSIAIENNHITSASVCQLQMLFMPLEWNSGSSSICSVSVYVCLWQKKTLTLVITFESQEIENAYSTNKSLSNDTKVNDLVNLTMTSILK